jgi:hypothetical protein
VVHRLDDVAHAGLPHGPDHGAALDVANEAWIRHARHTTLRADIGGDLL